MQASKVTPDRRQHTGFIEHHPVIVVGKTVFSKCGLFRLAQAAVSPMFREDVYKRQDLGLFELHSNTASHINIKFVERREYHE